ncbi:phage protein [Streptococcus dysgalactiae subsp. equisimilis]|nr:phage protein [Streptococcus dysgalactiae subsp. equisimilis]
MLGVTRKISVSEGMTLKTYAGYDVTLAEGNVPEGEVIPLSKVERKTHSEKKSNLKNIVKQRPAKTSKCMALTKL